jgi:hypothetical protein
MEVQKIIESSVDKIKNILTEHRSLVEKYILF